MQQFYKLLFEILGFSFMVRNLKGYELFIIRFRKGKKANKIFFIIGLKWLSANSLAILTP